MSWKRIALLFCIVVLSCSATFAQKSEQLKKLYDDHDWFQLREAVRKGNASAFYQGVAASISNDVVNTERHLQSVLKSSPASTEADDAYSFLTQTYMRVGRYRDALAVVERALRVKPDSEGFKNAHRLLGALSKYPEQSVSSRRYSRLRYTMNDGNLFVPVEVNGHSVSALVDTGANFSLISAEEAKRLGLTIRDGEGATIGDSSGANVDFRIAVAEKFTIGHVELGNAVFFVMRDDQQPFVNLPIGERVIVGMPILLALQSIRFDRNGTFEVDLSLDRRRASNMYFDGSEAIFEGEFAKQRIKIFLDTGATRTRVLSLFANQFQSFVNEHGTKSSDRITGVGSSVEVESMMLPEVKFRVTGTDLILKPAQVVLKDTAANSRWYHVWIGMDLLRQPRAVTIDFKAMTFDIS
jgi:predicted aspartyl protease